MNLECPKCRQPVPYDPASAGQTVQCLHCQVRLKLPTVDQLNTQKRAEENRQKKGGQKSGRKLERTREQIRSELTNRRLRALQALPRLDQPVPIESYKAIRVAASTMAIAACFLGAAAGVCLVVGLGSSDAMIGFAWAGLLAASAVGLGTHAGLITMRIHVAQDIRQTRALTMRIVELLEPQPDQALHDDELEA